MDVKRKLLVPCVMLAALLSACAGTKVVRNSMPGLDITGKKLWIVVDEQHHYEDYTNGLDSLWIDAVSSKKLEVELVYNEALSMHPVSPASLFESCGDSYVMRIFVSGSSETKRTDANGFVLGGGATVNYNLTMYSCATRQVVWKMLLSAEGSFPSYSQSRLVSNVFDDFKTNFILKE